MHDNNLELGKSDRHELSKTLTPRKILGYTFEMKAQSFLDRFGITYSGNPSDPIEWEKKVEKGSDIQTNGWEIKCKFHNTREHPSWIKKHTFPRFSTNKTHIVITNNKGKYSPACIDLLKSSNILLWDLDDLKTFFSMPSFTSIYNFIRDTNLLKSNNIVNIIIEVNYRLNKSCKQVNLEQLESLTLNFGQKNNDSINLTRHIKRCPFLWSSLSSLSFQGWMTNHENEDCQRRP